MSRRLIVAGALLVACGIVWYAIRSQLSLDRLIEQDRQLRDFIEIYPWRAFVISFAVYVVVSLFPGTSGKSVVAGWFFGFGASLVMVTVALTIAGVFGFSIARYIVGDVLRDRFRVQLARFDRAVQREGVFYLLTARLLHVPFTLVNYASGVGSVRPWTFVWTTLVGLVPSTMVFVGLGAGLPALEELRDRGAASLVSPAVVFALVAMGAVPWLVRWTVRRFRITVETEDRDLDLPARERPE